MADRVAGTPMLPRGGEITVTGGALMSTSIIPSFTSTTNFRNWFTLPVTFVATATSGSLNIEVTGGVDDSIWLFTDVLDGTAGISVAECTIDDPTTANIICTGNNDLQFDMTVTGSMIGATYNVDLGGTTIATGVSYGASTTFTIPNGADGTNKTITITDVDDSMCTRDVTITGVTACFSCDSGADGPRFLGLTKSTWVTIGIVTGIVSISGVLIKPHLKF